MNKRSTATCLSPNTVLIHAPQRLLPINPNQIIVFDNDLESSRVKSVEDYRVDLEFKCIESQDKIHVFKNLKDLAINDYIDLSYDRYEFFTYNEILKQDGEIFLHQKFYLNSDTNLKQGEKTTLEVTAIDEIEEIIKNSEGVEEKIIKKNITLDVVDKGLYSIQPDPELDFIANNGARISIDHIYKKLTSKKAQTNIIKNIIYGENFTVIELMNPLPENIIEGDLTTVKTKIYLEKPLVNNNRENEIFSIVRNTLPYLLMPYPDIEDEVAGKMLEDIFLKFDYKIHLIETKLNEILKKIS